MYELINLVFFVFGLYICNSPLLLPTPTLLSKLSPFDRPLNPNKLAAHNIYSRDDPAHCYRSGRMPVFDFGDDVSCTLTEVALPTVTLDKKAVGKMRLAIKHSM